MGKVVVMVVVVHTRWQSCCGTSLKRSGVTVLVRERVEPTGRVPDWEDASLSLSFGSAELGSDTSRRTGAEF